MKVYNPQKRLAFYKILLAVQVFFLTSSLGVAHYLQSLAKEVNISAISQKLAKEVFLPTTATVTSNVLILYADKSPKSSNLKTLKKGNVIVVMGRDANGWTPVKSGNATGWVLSSSIAVKKIPQP